MPITDFERRIQRKAAIHRMILSSNLRQLPIDDTFDAVHGHQQLSLFNAHDDKRRFLPIHIRKSASGKPAAMIPREGKTPWRRPLRP
jgi:hypothetical protein